ncbi:hypothetical protein [Ramlibacter sp. AN1133]|uniref:hypothetical protein n=1 Tax=Ramlibacter sp. AN1133 TaxID=3133429 RepID=UPI0030C141BA
MSRGPAELALEHAEHLSQAAEGLLGALREVLRARDRCEQDDSEDAARALDLAVEVAGEHEVALRERIHEFRERRDRCGPPGEDTGAAAEPGFRPCSPSDFQTLKGKTVRTARGEITTVRVVDFAYRVHCENGQTYPLGRLAVAVDQDPPAPAPAPARARFRA